MAKTKISATLGRHMVWEVDRLVRAGHFPSRSRAIQAALADMLSRRKRQRLAEELARIDPKLERALAEESSQGEPAWPRKNRLTI
jgi:Arc/MetJ-type ribon-helix-helix transcriptional regulator